MMPESKHYIVYPETIQGVCVLGDLNIDMRQKTRAGRSSRRQMALGCKPFLNSDNSIVKIIQKLHAQRQKQREFPQEN